MKAVELMIGDWVFVTHTEDGIAPYDEKVKLTKDDFGFSEDFFAAYVHPIPITTEILEKNGWKNSAPGVWQKEYGGFVFYWEERTGRFGMDDFRHLQEQWKIHLQIKHIHELQHVLHFCGIKKEIIL